MTPIADSVAHAAEADHIFGYSYPELPGQSAPFENPALFQSLMDHAHDGISVLTTSGMILDANSRLADILGTHRANLVGKHISVFVEPTNQRSLADFQRVVSNGTGIISDVHLIRRGGGTAIVDFSIA